MTVLGIDCSSRAVDLVLLDDDTNQARWFRLELDPNLTIHDRVSEIPSAFPGRSWFEEHGVWLVGLEDPMSRQAHTAKQLGIVTGAILALIPSGYARIASPPWEWKRVFIGNGNASKEEVGLHAREKLHAAGMDGRGFRHWEQDAFDAYAIAWAVRQVNNDAAESAA